MPRAAGTASKLSEVTSAIASTNEEARRVLVAIDARIAMAGHFGVTFSAAQVGDTTNVHDCAA